MNSSKKVLFLFLKRILLLVVAYQICRFLFYLSNITFFEDVSYKEFLGGLRFDLSAIAFINLIFVVLHFLPLKFVVSKLYQKFLTVAFFAVNILFLLTNFIDFQYYRFVNRRSTFSLITAQGMENEIGGLLQSFIVEYWYIPVSFAIFAYLFWLVLPKSINITTITSGFRITQSVLMLLFIGTFILLGRGGFQKKPLGIVHSNLYGTNQSTALVLNTPFCVLKTIGRDEKLEHYSFYSEDELNKIFNPIRKFEKNDTIQKNIVVIILESFGKENLNIGQTPFLDSLATQSLNFTNAFANGRASIDVVPSTMSSVPSLMNSSLLLSSYSINKIKGLPMIMKENGYSTSFFHGAFNGSQNFDKYSDQIGFEKYYGKDQYVGEPSFDGKWGIFDEEFLQFFAKEIGTFKEPFFTGIFTISSHAPFIMPEKYKNTNKFPKGTNEYHETIAYTDYALRRFFETAKTQPWYNNTLFIVTADHTSAAKKKPAKFLTPAGLFRIPMLFFDPSESLVKKGTNSKNIQQIDIYPTLLDLLQFETEIVTYGKPYSSNDDFIVNFSDNTYNYISGDYYLAFNGKETVRLHNIKKDPLMKDNLINKEPVIKNEMERFIKAYIQSFNYRVSNNKLTIDN